MEFRMFYWDTVVTNRASARSALREGDAARLRPLAPKWDRRTTRISETSEYSYELCGPDPTEDLYWLRQGADGHQQPYGPHEPQARMLLRVLCALGIQHTTLVAHRESSARESCCRTRDLPVH